MKMSEILISSAVCADVGGLCRNQWRRRDSTISRVLLVMIVPCALRATCALCVGSRQMNPGQFIIIRFWSSVDVVSNQRNVGMYVQCVIQKQVFVHVMKKPSTKWSRRNHTWSVQVSENVSTKCFVHSVVKLRDFMVQLSLFI